MSALRTNTACTGTARARGVRRRAYQGLAVAAGAALALGMAAAPASAQPGQSHSREQNQSTNYTVTVTGTGAFDYATDSPASPFIDKDGTFYFQESASLYGANAAHYWHFFTGGNLDTATPDQTLNTAVNPKNSKDSNDDTVWRCNTSPTGQEATADPPSYPEKNYCDLIGVWVDPDTDDWYGLVHNEFTGKPFGDGLHYDAIDVAESTNQGKTWKIVSHAITSPYSTKRGDTTAFPEQTYYYGDGDPRLFVDIASGYFYVYYGSRVVNKGGSWVNFYSHVARAPMAKKMASGSWHKFYDGTWSQPGLGGKESNLVPVTASNPNGYTPPTKAYNPNNPGTAQQQAKNGTAPPTSPLFVMNITYDAYLGLYLGTPQAVDQSGTAPQQVYATKSLATQKWRLIGDTGSYHTASWYRWFLDPANKTSSTIVGKSLRLYCAIACDNSGGQYADVDITSEHPVPPPIDLTKTYTITNGDGRVLSEVGSSSATASTAVGPSAASPAGESWYFVDDNDGSYSILNAATGNALGVNSSATSGRAWRAAPTVDAEAADGPSVGQEWWVIRDTTPDGHALGNVRLVNRYSGLVLSMSDHTGQTVATVPARYWTNTAGNQSAAQQAMSLAVSGLAPPVVSVSSPGTQTWLQNKAVSMKIVASSTTDHPLRYSATGLPTGVSIDKHSGLISGTPTGPGSGKATVTALAGEVAGTTSFDWTVQLNLIGEHTLQTPGGHTLQDPEGSSTPGVQLTVGTGFGDAQTWKFIRQSDGSYQLANKASGQCMDDNGGFTAPGTAAIQWACKSVDSSANNQRWKFTPVGDGAFTVTNEHTGLLLTAASDTNGATVTQETDSNSPLQRWKLSSLDVPAAANGLSVKWVKPGKARVAYFPQSTGGGKILKYTLTAVDRSPGKNHGSTVTASSRSNATTLTGLIDGDVYEVTETTTSTVGTSAPSKPLTLRTVPAAANGLSVKWVKPSKARVAYFPQRHSGAKVDRYTLTAVDQSPGEHHGEKVTASSRSNATTLTGLVDGDVYEVTETTTSTVGTSASSTPLTLPSGHD